MRPTILFRILFLVVSLGLGAAIVHAEDRAAIKARMEQRLGAIDAMKEKQLVGENNRGYLEARASLKPDQQKIVSDENSDRAEIYGMIAAKNGSTTDAVGRLRASKIAATSKVGVWVQTPQGEWEQKR